MFCSLINSTWQKNLTKLVLPPGHATCGNDYRPNRGQADGRSGGSKPARGWGSQLRSHSFCFPGFLSDISTEHQASGTCNWASALQCRGTTFRVQAVLSRSLCPGAGHPFADVIRISSVADWGGGRVQRFGVPFTPSLLQPAMDATHTNPSAKHERKAVIHFPWLAQGTGFLQTLPLGHEPQLHI